MKQKKLVLSWASNRSKYLCGSGSAKFIFVASVPVQCFTKIVVQNCFELTSVKFSGPNSGSNVKKWGLLWVQK